MDELIKALRKKPESLYIEGKKISHIDYTLLNNTEKKNITAVDGGSAILLETPSARVLFVRIIAATFAERKTIVKKEGYVLASFDEVFTVTFYPLEGKSQQLFSITPEELSEHSTLEQAANLGRKILEWRLAKEISGIVMWDGSFTIKNSIEKQEVPNCLALAKTTGTLGNWELFAHAPKQPWRAQAVDNTWFVKLHEKSRHYFRVDASEPELIENLVAWSTDPVFLGYPYPLIFADQLARVSNEEAAVLKIKLQTKLGSDWEELSVGSTTRDAHSILDSLQY